MLRLRHLFILMLLLFSLPAWATDTLVLGVFAYRPKQILEKRYQPIADYLGTQLGGIKIELRILTQDEIDAGLKAHQLDLIFTNPSHYTVLRHRFKFTGALATLISLESGRPTSQLGGVIFTRADDDRIHTLSELRGHQLIVPGINYLGGYQTQAYELLKAGVHIPQDVQINEVGSHDAVIKRVLAGEGDAGFIRTGLIEQLVAEGKLDLARLRIINRQDYPGFPYLVSTRLYPEWAFVALPHVSKERIRKIAAALMSLESTHPAARSAGIAGFAPPHDYLPVESIMRDLHSSPFDKAEPITLEELWKQHRLTLLVMLVAIALVSLLLILLVRRNRIVEAQRDQLKAMAFVDGLTGVANRRHFDEVISAEWKRCRRERLPISLIMIDIDFFKRYNDNYGHQQGDECLCQVAKAVQGCLSRSSDLIARYGGEEFVCILPNTDTVGCLGKAEQMRGAVAALSIPHEKSEAVPIVTISVGLSTMIPEKTRTPEDLIRAADKQLYQAKETGRNKVCSSCDD